MAIIDGVSVSGTTYGLRDNDTNSGIAPTFSTSTAYAAGQYVWYDSGSGAKLYRFAADHAAGAWTGTDAIEVKLGNDVSDLQSAITLINNSGESFLSPDLFSLGKVAMNTGNTASTPISQIKTTNIQQYNYPITFTSVDSAYVGKLVVYNSDSDTKNYNLTDLSQYVPWTLAAGTRWRLCIVPVDEDESVAANIPVVATKVHLATYMTKGFDEANKHLSFIDSEVDEINSMESALLGAVYDPFYIYPEFQIGEQISDSTNTQRAIAKNVITLTGTQSVVTFKNLLSVSVGVAQMKYDTATSTSGAATSDTSVSAGSTITINNSTRKYYGIRVTRASGRFTDYEIKLLKYCCQISDSVAKNGVLNDLSGNSYNTILKRLIADERKLTDLAGKSVPSYFETQIDDAISSVRANMEEHGKNGETFVFITDPHWQWNQKNSPALVREIINNTNVKTVICGGDILDSGAVADETRKAIDFFDDFRFVENGIRPTFGNHDSNQNNHSRSDPEEAALIFSDNKVWALEYAQANNVITVGGYFYYYFDIPATKTRYVCLSTFFNDSNNATAQASWFTSLMAASEDWNVIVFTHALLTYDGEISSTFAHIATLCDNCNTHSNIKLIMCGHVHNDATGETAGGIPIILTDTDAASRLNEHNPYYNQNLAGTVDEQCFDVVSVNYTNGKIKCVRVGRGSSRTVPAET